MNVSQPKVFICGVVLGAVVGAAFLGPIVHLVLIGVVAAAVGLALYRGRRLLLRRPKPKGQLKA
jgi:O-antigen/teichoic acid export membrane protein